MDSRTFVVNEREVVITDKTVLELREKVENLEIDPMGAAEKIRRRLFELYIPNGFWRVTERKIPIAGAKPLKSLVYIPPSNLSTRDWFRKYSELEALYEELTRDFFTPYRRFTPFNEAYAMKHRLSGKLTA